MVPFKSLGAVSYSPCIVTMAVSLAISEILSVKEWPDLENWVWVVQGNLKWRGSIDHVRLSITPPYCDYSSIVYSLRDKATYW